MKLHICLSLFLLFLCGCSHGLQKGKCTSTTQDGQVISVTVYMPKHNGNNDIQLTNKVEVQKLIDDMELLLVELKDVHSKMKTKE